MLIHLNMKNLHLLFLQNLESFSKLSRIAVANVALIPGICINIIFPMFSRVTLSFFTVLITSQ